MCDASQRRLMRLESACMHECMRTCCQNVVDRIAAHLLLQRRADGATSEW